MDVHKAITVSVVLNALDQMESHSKVKTKNSPGDLRHPHDQFECPRK